jgi:hypothetical protein
MDIQQLKLLSGRIRGLLEQSNHSVTHSQALDLSGALVGLRNWPEVQAFPSRVTAAELDLAATGRLSYRLRKRHDLELSAEELFSALRPPAEAGDIESMPQIWPSGPRPGVYVTTEQEHINALLAAYDEATDGGLVYAERAGNHWDSSIDLGENGLWSSGMERVPSGTLLVVGPLEMNQQAWEEAASRLESACLKAQAYGHRVAVLVHTDTPHTLFHDLDLMVRMKEPEGDDTHEALLGDITAEGELVLRAPFVEPLPQPVFRPSVAPLDPLPRQTVPLLRKALEARRTGLLILGSSEIQEHWAVDLVNAVLPLTDFAGPAARIKPRDRSTPAKDWNVPDALKALPFLPSIESAYSQGYRRMVVNPSYSDADLLLEYGSEVLFIAGGHGSSVDDLFLGGVRFSRYEKVAESVGLLVAILAVTRLKTGRLDIGLPDLYIPDGRVPGGKDKLESLLAMLHRDRVLRAEDELSELLDQKRVTPAAVKKAITRTKWVSDLLAQRSKGALSASTK